MEIKALLNKPYTEEERIDFIIEQNHNNGYEIAETEEALEAWGYTEEEKQEQERERINNLTQTRADVWRALIQARMFPKSQVKAMIEAMPEETDEQKMAKEIARIDVDDVEDFHRGHELVNLVGDYLGITSENLDLYFETGDYHYLQEQPEPEPEVVDEQETSQDEPEPEE